MSESPRFATREISAFHGFITRSLDRLVSVATALDSESLNWRPPAPSTNSVASLVLHTFGNTEENLLGTLLGQAVERDRATEFGHTTTGAIRKRWEVLQPELDTCFKRLTAADLDSERSHPRRGALTGREILIVVARHAAEHLGQAELTRDLAVAFRRIGATT